MPLLFDGKPTRLQAGDILDMNVESQMVSLERNEKPIVRENQRDDYYIAVADGVQIRYFIRLVADSGGLDYEELGLIRDSWRFRFI